MHARCLAVGLCIREESWLPCLPHKITHAEQTGTKLPGSPKIWKSHPMSKRQCWHGTPKKLLDDSQRGFLFEGVKPPAEVRGLSTSKNTLHTCVTPTINSQSDGLCLVLGPGRRPCMTVTRENSCMTPQRSQNRNRHRLQNLPYSLHLVVPRLGFFAFSSFRGSRSAISLFVRIGLRQPRRGFHLHITRQVA